MTDVRHDLIEVNPNVPGELWQPVTADEANALMLHKGFKGPERAQILGEARRILSRCLPPTAGERYRTGLAVGYVQSGKTLSFTTIAALARDNDFRLVIVVAGTKTNLLGQSTDRLESDLRLTTREDRVWYTLLNPTLQNTDVAALQATLDAWERPINRTRKKTVLVTVMKHHQHLDNLSEVLRGVDLSHCPALIIDDEADQAGLNNRLRQNEESTTYQTLTDLRRVVPCHSFLGYTATPQALLLINRIDLLSPEFAEVLTPGADYTGGLTFFGPQLHLVRSIPAAEIPSPQNVLTEPPESLLVSLRLFLLGVAAGLITESGSGHRSMMIHPSQSRGDHQIYVHWVREIKRNWRDILASHAGDPDRADLLDEFRRAYDDLRQTVEALPSFEELVGELQTALTESDVVELNTRGQTRIPDVNWRNSYAKIIVGGNAMDRGFTVEGLTVTYMPRTLGGGNADTLQQRARFYGYKRSYIGYCRIYLEAGVRRALHSYVEHEELLREALVKHSESGLPLSDWRRRFFLDPALSPTRSSVLGLPIMRGNVRGWYFPKVPHDTDHAIENNRAVFERFLDQNRDGFIDCEGDPRRTPAQRHKLLAGARLADIYEHLLVPLHFTASVDTAYFGLLLQIERHLRARPNARVDLYNMSSPEERFRDLKNQQIENPFQGANANTGYPGARDFKSGQHLTVQIYTFDLGGTRVQPTFQNVPLVALNVPSALGAGWVVERRNAGAN